MCTKCDQQILSRGHEEMLHGARLSFHKRFRLLTQHLPRAAQRSASSQAFWKRSRKYFVHRTLRARTAGTVVKARKYLPMVADVGDSPFIFASGAATARLVLGFLIHVVKGFRFAFVTRAYRRP